MSSIRADLQLNCAQFLGGIREVSESIEHVEHKILAFAGAFEGLKIGAELVTEQFEHLHEALELGDKMNDLQANTGQTITDLTVLRQAFANAGLGADGVQPAFKNLAKALTGVNEEGEPTKEVFEKLGLSLSALKDMSAVQQLVTLQAAFKELPNPADRAKAAMDLFGKAGGTMLALLSEDEALTTARRQVGQLGETLQANAKTFDAISDAIGALHLKFDQFYTGLAAGVAGDAKSFFEWLSELDFTGAGATAGALAKEVGQLVKLIVALKPVIMGAVAAMIAFELRGRLGATVLNTTMANAYGKSVNAVGAFIGRLRMAELSMISFGTVAKTAFGGLKSAANGVFNALGGKVGFAVAGLAVGFDIYMQKVERAKAATRGLQDVLADMETHNMADFAGVKNVASEDERREMMKKLDDELAEVHKRLQRVDDDYENLNDEGRAEIVKQFERWAANIQGLQKGLEKIPPEVLAGRAAERHRQDAIEASKKKVEELQKAYADLTKEIAKEKFDALTPDEQRKKLLDEAHVNAPRQLQEEIDQDQRKVDAGELTDPDEVAAAEHRIALMRQMLEVEKRISEERKRQAEQAIADQSKADEEKKKLSAFDRKSALEIAKLQAQGRGDDKEEDRIDRIQRYDQAFDEAKTAGKGTMEADSIARQKVAAQDAAKAEQDREKDKQPEAKLSVFADSDRRVGLGGSAFGSRTDPLVKAHQDSTRATTQLKSSIDNLATQLKAKPERIVVPGQAIIK